MDGGADRRGDASEATKAAHAAIDGRAGLRRPARLRGGRARPHRTAAGRREGAGRRRPLHLGPVALRVHPRAAAEAPETVNPSLWRQMQLAVQGGLYEVVPGPVPGAHARPLEHHDRRGRRRARRLRPADLDRDRPRGARALLRSTVRASPWSRSCTPTATSTTSAARAASSTRPTSRAGKVRVIAPIGFLEAAVAENVLAGNVMSRRASYMYGNLLPADPKGQVGAGLGRHDVGRHGQPDPADRARDRDRAADDDRRAGLRVHARPGHRGAGGDALVHRAVRRGHRRGELLPHAAQHVLDPRHARSATRSPGRSTSSRRSTCGATAPRSCTACTTGRHGAASGCSSCSAWPATATASSTTRRCGWPTTG